MNASGTITTASNSVGQKNPQIDRAKPGRVPEDRRPPVQIIRQVAVVGDVTAEKERGGNERRDHAIAVGRLVLAADEVIAGAQEDRADAIEAGVDGGQVGRGSRLALQSPDGGQNLLLHLRRINASPGGLEHSAQLRPACRR